MSSARDHTGPLPDGTEVRVADGHDWALWRTIRLRALADSPSAFGSTYEREAGFLEQHWRGRLEDPDTVGVLARDRDGRPVALGGGYPDLPGFLHVVAMWVDPTVRGRGVAQAVLRCLEGWADARGRRLHLDVNTANTAARRAYRRYGFVSTTETRSLRPGSPDVCERMVLGDPSPLR